MGAGLFFKRLPGFVFFPGFYDEIGMTGEKKA